MIDDQLIKEIDSIHKSTNEALALRQFDNYINYFADDLQYKQLSGKTIGKKQLTKDTRSYFDRIRNFSGGYERKDITVDNNKIIERLIQHAKVSIRVFIFFSKNWVVEREGIYEWTKSNDSWKIVKVEILKEKIS